MATDGVGLRSKSDSEINSLADAIRAILAGGKKQTKPGRFDCSKCDNKFSLEDAFQLSACSHKFCRDCGRQFLRDSYYILRCPMYPTCRAPMSLEDASLVLEDTELGFCSVDDENCDRADEEIAATQRATFTCAICSQVPSIEDVFDVGKACSHQLCRNCAAQHIVTSWYNNRSTSPTAVLCPVANCQAEVDFENIETILDFSELQLGEPQPTFDCGICMETKPFDDIFQLENCEHFMCRKCARDYLCSLIDEQKSLVCYMAGCEAELTLIDAEMVLDAEQYQRLSKMLLNKGVVGCVNCPKTDCPGLAEVVPPRKLFLCPECHYLMCVDCRKDWHPTVTCVDYARWLEENGAADEKFNDYVKDKKVQVCPVCRQGVEKSEGCNHMACRCGAHFCYLCGKRFSVKNWEEHGKCLLFEYNFA